MGRKRKLPEGMWDRDGTYYALAALPAEPAADSVRRDPSAGQQLGLLVGVVVVLALVLWHF